MTPRVSIVIPTLNAGETLEDVLAAIRSQDCDRSWELIAIDSGSTDRTLDRLARHGVRVLRAPPGLFNHGATRNAALAAARGEFAVLLVQDAVPASRRWLQALLQPLISDPTVAGSFARQEPAPDASAVTTYYLSRWVAAGAAPRTIGPLTRGQFDRMSPADRHTTCAFDNVCSCVRLSVWRRHPFATTPIAEDLEWGRDVLLAGYRLTYAADAVVRHSHERSVAYELQRTYLVHHRLQELFGLATVPTIRSLIRSVAATVPHNTRIAATDAARGSVGIIRAAALGVAMPLGQYLGARAAREGRPLLRTTGI
jgi:glycosyltransferase involved in cell wall biosynthesis